MIEKALRMKNFTPLEASSLKMIFLLLVFGIGAVMVMAGQQQVIRDHESHIASLKDELVNAEALSAVK
jgi:hypothetical protein